MPEAKELILVHNGALGDFLQAWPGILALSGELAERRLLWAGREAYSLWTTPLGLTDSPAHRRRVSLLYGASQWPRELGDARVVWFGLRRPPTEVPLPGLWFVPMLDEEKDTPPRRVCLQWLQGKGLAADRDWKRAWLELFPPEQAKRDPLRVLIFPGAGHPGKCWPLERFLRVADWLREQGYRVCFVLGPAEQERGLRVDPFPWVAPEDLGQLQEWIQSSGFILGNDSGPMHLAGCCQVPGLALFGPSPARQWGPEGIHTISGSAPCRPCTRMGRVGCSDPECLRDISVHRVTKALQQMLAQSDTGAINGC